MSSQADHRYWAERAEAELARARSARGEEARRAHQELAGLYLNRVYGGEAEVPAQPMRLARA